MRCVGVSEGLQANTEGACCVVSVVGRAPSCANAELHDKAMLKLVRHDTMDSRHCAATGIQLLKLVSSNATLSYSL